MDLGQAVALFPICRKLRIWEWHVLGEINATPKIDLENIFGEWIGRSVAENGQGLAPVLKAGNREWKSGVGPRRSESKTHRRRYDVRGLKYTTLQRKSWYLDR